MTSYSLTLQQRHEEELAALLRRNNGAEWAAYLLCTEATIDSSPFGGESHIKLLSHKVVAVSEEEVLVSAKHQVKWSTEGFVRCLKKAVTSTSERVVAIVHIHPEGPLAFSEVDDRNEPDLWELAYNRNGPDTRLISLLFDGGGGIHGRVWESRECAVPLDIIRVVGRGRIRLHYDGRGEKETPEAFDRQYRAFGKAFIHDLGVMTVGVVGGGGTGSPTAIMLARLGVGKIVLFDKDKIDETNLNRVYGSRKTDVDKTDKVDVIKREIGLMGLGTQVASYPYWVGDERCRDALKSCDVVFGCTDDDDGRFLLNRLAYYYLIPVFDMGLAIQPNEDVNANFHALDARYTVVSPGETCMSCRGIIDPKRASEQALKRANPEEYERQKAEAYVIGEGDPSPAVITFTTECATMAINEFIHHFQPFRNNKTHFAMLQRRLHLPHDLRPGHKPKAGCPLCDSDERWARGDVEPFLDRVG